jgi:hypothetical protein
MIKERNTELREALGLQKEMKMFQRYAGRLGAPKGEVDYYNRMAANTSTKINWRLIEKQNQRKESFNED